MDPLVGVTESQPVPVVIAAVAVKAALLPPPETVTAARLSIGPGLSAESQARGRSGHHRLGRRCLHNQGYPDTDCVSGAGGDHDVGAIVARREARRVDADVDRRRGGGGCGAVREARAQPGGRGGADRV